MQVYKSIFYEYGIIIKTSEMYVHMHVNII